MKKEKVPTLHDLAVRLCEGGVIDYGGYALKAKDVGHEENPCYLCSMDCVCNMAMTDLCAECDAVTRTKHILMFAN
jgi:hypothetical protein